MNAKKLKEDFPIFNQKINDYDLVYLDSAATTQKPYQVIDALTNFYAHEYASIYRGVYGLAEHATEKYEIVRDKTAKFINARIDEIVFTKGSTAGINFIATAWGCENLSFGDEIVLTELEHHANLIPWQQIAQKTGAILKFIPVKQDGILDYSNLDEIITEKTKLVGVISCSNALGTHVDLKPIISRAHNVGAKILVDATQTTAHRRIDVKKLNIDFLVFSAHKMMGPTGLGVLYINKKWHDEVGPYQYGGAMVYDVDWQHATWREAPFKYEAGTPPIAQVIAFGAALDYFNETINFNMLAAHEAFLCNELINNLSRFEKVRIVGPIEQLKKDGHLVSFVVDGYHSHDIAAYLAEYGICVRAGNHCARPLHVKLGVETTVRASFYVYNTLDDINFLIEKLKLLIE